MIDSLTYELVHESARLVDRIESDLQYAMDLIAEHGIEFRREDGPIPGQLSLPEAAGVASEH